MGGSDEEKGSSRRRSKHEHDEERHGRRKSRDKDRDRSSRHRSSRSRDRRSSRRSHDRDRDRDHRSRSRRDDGRSSRRHDDDRDRRRRHDDRDRRDKTERDTKPKDHKQDEMMEITRDARTVFVGQLVSRAKERDVREFFEALGPVNDVQLIRDRVSGKSRGMGYVEFADLETVPKAVQMNGEKFMGFPLLVKQSEAEKNYAFEAENEGGTVFSDNVNKRVYIGNIHRDVTEDDLRQIFENLGNVEKVQLIRDAKGESKGYGFIMFKEQRAVAAALSSMNGIDLAGQKLRVGVINQSGQIQDAEGNQWSLEDPNQASLSAQARAALIANLSAATNQAAAQLNVTLREAKQKLANEPARAKAGVPEEGPGPHGEPSRFLLLSNVVDPEEQHEPYWDMVVLDDVDEECSKFGTVLSVRVDPRDPAGCVYVEFDRTEETKKAAKELAGRYYAGRTIVAQFLVERIFEKRRPPRP